MKLYYWKDRKNFGDLLSPLLIKKFIREDCEWAPARDPELEMVMVGSILEHLPWYFRGIILGSGKLHENSAINLELAHVLAVRGPLTAKSFEQKVVMADPGLIADELVGYQEKEYEIGIIPHWSDKGLATDPRFAKYKPRIIDVAGEPLYVIREIGRCKKIISSSLHGIVVADAFGIPRRIEIAPRMLTHSHQEGGLFKWEDYSASLNMSLKIGVTEEADRNKVTELQHELFDTFQEVISILRKEDI